MSSIWHPDTDHIRLAVERLAAGGLIAVPTETVYGLAGDAANGEAVARIYETKGRPRFNPLIVHVASLDQAEAIAMFDARARALTKVFWPGPLTMVLPLKPGAPIASLVTAGLDTVALRMPRHLIARALLAAFGRPFVAPSANRSGHVSPTTATHVVTEFGDAVPVLDGGACEAGLESTIVGLAGEVPTLLRPGTLTAGEIETVLGQPLAAPSSGIEAPGMMLSHYAPAAAVRLNAESAKPGEKLLGFGGTPGADLDLSPGGDLTEAAANLFAYLRQLDTGDTIAVAPIPTSGLGTAINDRLTRAAAPRPRPAS